MSRMVLWCLISRMVYKRGPPENKGYVPTVCPKPNDAQWDISTVNRMVAGSNPARGDSYLFHTASHCIKNPNRTGLN